VKPLSVREREVLALVAQGETSKEIGRLLDLHFKTVDLYADRAVTKLNAKNRTHAAVLWDRMSVRPLGGWHSEEQEVTA
jgi:DNA-binding NarL/FixJ family response regulator